MVDATDDATSTIKDAGAPSTPNGAKIAAVFVSGFKAISKEFAKAQAKAEKLPTDSVDRVQDQGQADSGPGAQRLGRTRSARASTAVDKLDKGKKLESRGEGRARVRVPDT